MNWSFPRLKRFDGAFKKRILRHGKENYRAGQIADCGRTGYTISASWADQVIDDVNEKTLFAFSTLDKDFKKDSPKGSTVESGKSLGKFVSEKMKKKGISKVAFDRAGYRYHGRIQALTEALREGGIQF